MVFDFENQVLRSITLGQKPITRGYEAVYVSMKDYVVKGSSKSIRDGVTWT